MNWACKHVVVCVAQLKTVTIYDDLNVEARDRTCITNLSKWQVNGNTTSNRQTSNLSLACERGDMEILPLARYNRLQNGLFIKVLWRHLSVFAFAFSFSFSFCSVCQFELRNGTLRLIAFAFATSLLTILSKV